jgi:hypothetical protein
MEELTNKVIKILKAKFPDYTEEEMDDMIKDYADITTLRLLDAISKEFKNKQDLDQFGKLFGEAQTNEAFAFAESKGINVTSIFETVSKSVVMDIFS